MSTPGTVFMTHLTQHQCKLMEVMADRAAWFEKGHEALVHEDMAALRHLYPLLPVVQAKKPMTVAYTYAMTVFAISAIEAFLLHAYHNAVKIWMEWKRQYPPRLAKWLEKRDSGRRHSNLSENLKSLSFSNIPQAEEWFGEIYGQDCFRSSMGDDKQYKKLKDVCAKLSEKRNAILHQGGETKKGVFIEVSFPELEADRRMILSFGQTFSRWIMHWWLAQMKHDHDLALILDSLAAKEGLDLPIKGEGA